MGNLMQKVSGFFRCLIGRHDYELRKLYPCFQGVSYAPREWHQCRRCGSERT